MIPVFLDLRTALDSGDREVLWRFMSLKSMLEKLISLTQSLYAND